MAAAIKAKAEENPGPSAPLGAPVPKKRGLGGGGLKLYSSPSEVLSRLSPPNCALTLNFRDHRFVSTWKISSEKWQDFPELKKKTFTRTFNKDGNWLAQLQEVHRSMWTKWAVCPEENPLDLDSGQCEQEPGMIEDDIIAELTPIIRGLPAKTKYPQTH